MTETPTFEKELAEAYEPNGNGNGETPPAPEAVDTSTTAEATAAEEEASGPVRIKKRLTSRDVKKFAKILGRVREMATKRAQVRAKMQADGIEDEDALPVNVDMWTMLMTDGLDYAEKEINLWFAALCEIELTAEEVNEYRAKRAQLSGDENYKLSQWDRENALNEKIAEMDVAFYSDVISDLQQHGGLGDFLTALNRLGESMNSARGQ